MDIIFRNSDLCHVARIPSKKNYPIHSISIWVYGAITLIVTIAVLFMGGWVDACLCFV